MRHARRLIPFLVKQYSHRPSGRGRRSYRPEGRGFEPARCLDKSVTFVPLSERHRAQCATL